MASEIHESAQRSCGLNQPLKAKAKEEVKRQIFFQPVDRLDKIARKRQGLLSLCQILQLT